ncbi:MAG: glycosyltransferase [Acidobacteriota bacterium]
MALAESYPLSVVIPARNVEDKIERCLEAIVAGTFEHAEIIVVDDASVDATTAIVQCYLDRSDVKIRCVGLKERLGPAAARNRGLELARYPYVLFLDADVVLSPNSLQWIRESLELYCHRPEVIGVLGSYSEMTPFEDFFTNFKNLQTCFLYKTTETLSPFLHTPMMCIRKEVLESAAGFDPEMDTAEDFRLGIVLGTRGYRFVIDRRIEGLHLKRYSLPAIFKEDWRRIRDLKSIRLNRGERRFYFRAHRVTRLLSLALPGPALALLALIWVNQIFGVAALILIVIFYLLNLNFLAYCRKKRGWLFAVQSAAFLFVEMLWAEIAALVARKRSLQQL